MNRVLKICCLLYVCVLSFSTGVAQVVDTARWDLNRISSWMLTQIQYPEDAYKYHTAGIEQLCLSVAWDGRVFVSSRFSTLNPAFEREIERVVRRAPRCNTPLLDIEDANKYMWIDFYEFLPEEKRREVERISLYMPPRFASEGQVLRPFNGRENFMEWICARMSASGVVTEDTLSIEYTVNEKGCVCDVEVAGGDAVMVSKVKQIMEESPRWRPAKTVDKRDIAVTWHDCLIARSGGAKGEKSVYIPYLKDVYANTHTSPSDVEKVILNPEIPPVYQGERSFLGDLATPFKDLLQQKKINEDYSVAGSFVIEKNGKASNIHFDSLPDFEGFNADSILRTSIGCMDWVAAHQGGIPVRTKYSFAFVGHKKSVRVLVEPDYKVYGKHFIHLQANPAKMPYGYILNNGDIYAYPFTTSGMFDYRSYYKGLFYYHQMQGKGNLSDKYLQQVYRRYVR
ncbi:hypothetical protein [Phocaeicola plebeius]|jgi:hypothetical protein|uniref:hypothetical protein n=1 Tax=Phocaeicola plebeius TaxID=310297 RepID=UPI0011C0EE14|nr:hypothetical protein [Phocaeicola plebeius]